MNLNQFENMIPRDIILFNDIENLTKRQKYFYLNQLCKVSIPLIQDYHSNIKNILNNLYNTFSKEHNEFISTFISFIIVNINNKLLNDSFNDIKIMIDDIILFFNNLQIQIIPKNRRDIRFKYYKLIHCLFEKIYHTHSIIKFRIFQLDDTL